MKLEWLREYRELVEKMIKFGNRYASQYQKERSFGTPVPFSPSQLQVMEYILENEEKHQNMGEIAARLGISSSAFSKNVKKMEEKGLLERYHTTSNRKNIIVKVSPLGKEVYAAYSHYALEHLFGPLFQLLDDIPPEEISRFAKVIDLWCELSSNSRKPEDPDHLIKIN